MNERTIYLPRLFIIPILITALKYKVFMYAGPEIWLFYLTGLTIGLLMGNKIANREKIESTTGALKIKLPGNYSTLTILMIFFCIKYMFGYIEATNKILPSYLSALEISINGLFSGYFLGKALNYWRRIEL